MKIKKSSVPGLIVVFILFGGFGFLSASGGENLVVNGDFETGDTGGWIIYPGSSGTGNWIQVVEMDASGNYYLRLQKDWWGYNNMYQDIFVTDADVDIKFSLRPVQLGQAGIFPVQEGVGVNVELYDENDGYIGCVQHYFATWHTHTTNGAFIYIKLGNAAQDDWAHIAYSLKDMILSYEPGFDFSEVVRIRVRIKNWQASHRREWSIGYYDDISITEKVIEASVDVKPNTLNTKSKGKWMTAYIQLPDEYNIDEVDISTIRLEVLSGTFPAESWPTGIGDHNNDGVPDLTVKFKRADICSLLSGVNGNVTFYVSGQLSGGNSFIGEDTIRVK